MSTDPNDLDGLWTEVAGDFDELARLFQQAIDSEASDGPSLEALARAKAAAEKGANLARQVVGPDVSNERRSSGF